MTAPTLLRLRRPDDLHVHLRDGRMLELAVEATARQFARATVMPNLVPPIVTRDAARAYRDRILAACPDELEFTPLMTAYLTDTIDPEEVSGGFEDGTFAACKLYPAGATTNSDAGVTDVRNIAPVLERMQAIGMPLLVHGEVVRGEVDVFDREAVFIESVLGPLVDRFPALKIVLEHITTKEAVDFVTAAPANVAATITAHHLLIDRNAMFDGGLRPHAYCLPVAKRRLHRDALRKAAVSGDPKFFLGTDSAPHPQAEKESACGCAGIYSAPVALESYARVFEEEGQLDRLEAFAGEHGARFYGIPLNEGSVTLERVEHRVPDVIRGRGQTVVPFAAGENLGWRVH